MADVSSGGADVVRESSESVWRRGRDADEMEGEDFEPMLEDVASKRLFLWVRSCCFILSFRVKALLQVGQWIFFSPVCFLPWRAACPEVVNVSLQENRAA